MNAAKDCIGFAAKSFAKDKEGQFQKFPTVSVFYTMAPSMNEFQPVIGLRVENERGVVPLRSVETIDDVLTVLTYLLAEMIKNGEIK